MENFSNTMYDPITGSIVFAVLFIIALLYLVYFANKLDKAQKWEEIQNSMYVKVLNKVVGMQLYVDQLEDELKIAEKSTKHKGLRKQIAGLKHLNYGYIMTIKNMDKDRQRIIDDFTEKESELNDRIKSLTETIEHRKHTKVKEVAETGYWTPKGDVQIYADFEIGKVYRQGGKSLSTLTLLLIDKKGDKKEVAKCRFTSAPEPEF